MIIANVELEAKRLYDRINQHTEEVLVIYQNSIFRLIASGTPTYDKALKSKITMKRALGVYDYMVTLKQLIEDVETFSNG